MPLGYIICGFAGVGKSSFYERCSKRSYKYGGKDILDVRDILDLDSSEFSSLTSFPINYIDEVESKLPSYDYILISSHDSVIKELNERKIYHFVVYPKRELKQKYMKNYIKRGSSLRFLNKMDRMWDKYITDCENAGPYSIKVVLDEDEYLYSVFKN